MVVASVIGTIAHSNPVAVLERNWRAIGTTESIAMTKDRRLAGFIPHMRNLLFVALAGLASFNRIE